MPISMTSTPPSPTNDTRDRILDAAERLFVENGFDGTSMRMITGAANANLAAINYHFGGKDALVQEVFRRRLAALNARRLDELDRLATALNEMLDQIERLTEAFFGTALELAADTEHGGRTFMRLLARTYNEPNAFVRQFLAEEYAEVMDRFLGALFRALPEVPRAEILWRFHFMIGAMAFAIAGLGGLSELMEVGPQDEDPARLLPRLMSFLLGGLRAPLPDGGLQG